MKVLKDTVTVFEQFYVSVCECQVANCQKCEKLQNMENGVNFAIPWEVLESKSFQLQAPPTSTRGSAPGPCWRLHPRPPLGKLVLRFLRNFALKCQTVGPLRTPNPLETARHLEMC